MTDPKQFGCFYLHFFYPSNIYIPDGDHFLFTMNQKKYSLLVVKHLKSLVVNDLNNQILRLKEGNSNFQPITKNIEVSEKALSTVLEGDADSAAYIIDYANHYHKEYYKKEYTEIVISFDSYVDSSNISEAQTAMEFFISCYRLVADDVLTLQLDKMPYVSKVFKEYFHPYTTEELLMTEETRIQTSRAVKLNLKQVQFPFWNIQGKKFLTDPSVNAANLKKYFLENSAPNSLSEFLLKAREEYHIHQNYKYSFIESWTVIEISITSFLRTLKLEKGISKSRIDDFEGEVGISYLINIEMPLVYENPTDPKFKEILGKIDGIRKLRNKLIHENQFIGEAEALKAMSIATECLNFLGYKKY